MNIKIVSISIFILFILFIGCKDRKDKDGLGYDEKELEALRAKLTGKASDETSTAKDVKEIKALNQEEIENVTGDIKMSAQRALRSTENEYSNKSKSEFINEIRESTQRFDFALNSLVASGLSNAGAVPALDNIAKALESISLIGKLTDVLENNENTMDDAKEALKALGKHACINNIENDKEALHIKNTINTCARSLLTDIDSYFAIGVRDLLFNGEASNQFKDAIENLRVAAHDISRAAKALKSRYY
ncbi:hypothetical protein [Borrelia sp. RT5S]|uniref:hypothetical protein n=1 Tax=Borrelia sp. RT5S TaxID=2898581 RepID=UPI001E30979D|nr:hypothetical protein [Borrelia sp. RT5S]UGQ16740.1 hypothetical protein LSO06_05315 [Borrelia sp. RT5S]